VVAVAAAMAAVGAYAYWTANGTGMGTASVGTDDGVTIDPITFSGDLYPGHDVTVTFTVKNDSSNAAVNVHKVVQDGPVTGLPAGCLPADFSFADVTLGGVDGLQLTENDGLAGGTDEHTDNTGTLAMANTAVNQDACKNAQPVLHLKIDNTGIGGS
jgi:hypothetical protein